MPRSASGKVTRRNAAAGRVAQAARDPLEPGIHAARKASRAPLTRIGRGHEQHPGDDAGHVTDELESRRGEERRRRTDRRPRKSRSAMPATGWGMTTGRFTSASTQPASPEGPPRQQVGQRDAGGRREQRGDGGGADGEGDRGRSSGVAQRRRRGWPAWPAARRRSRGPDDEQHQEGAERGQAQARPWEGRAGPATGPRGAGYLWASSLARRVGPARARVNVWHADLTPNGEDP